VGFVFAPAIHGSLSTTDLSPLRSPCCSHLRPSGLRLARADPSALDNKVMAPVDSKELQAVLADDLATQVAVHPEGPESYRSRK